MTLPLSGVRVLDIATFIAAPYCATIFSEFGAEVIKVEHPVHGDPLRNMGTRTDGGETLTWLSEGRNKKAITLDLSKPEGADLFKQLVATTDIVVENFRPGTMERWGLGYDELTMVNHKLVLLRVSGFGQDGPYRDRPGFARMAHAYGGLTYLSGMADGPPVIPGSTSLGDYISGLYGAIGALIAFREAERSGKGQVIDVSLYESVFRVLDELAPAFSKYGIVRERSGPDAPTLAPHTHYQCADGHWIAVACSSDKLFHRLATLMKREDLASDPRFSTMQLRVRHKDELNDLVGNWVGQHTRSEILKKMFDHEIPASSINSIKDLFEDEHFLSRETIRFIEDASAGKLAVPNVYPRLSRTPGKIKHLGRKKSEDTEYVLQELLGLSGQELNDLRQKKII